ncbi:MAG TPA: ATP-grasp domain-containing protein [Candidatus Dormibacteraeota bacterium]|jgi:predicted ATP-grasp superfamily ATP-dependent carboligase|nr:ATP-grasp domain-containing protein [Candidatus Dormibacteraeota bacterium]
MSEGRPGALVLGSDFRGLAAVRALGRKGIPSFVVCNDPRSAWYSRYSVGRERWAGKLHGDDFRDYLLELADRRGLRGWVLYALQDETVETVAENAGVLGDVYRLTTPGWDSARRALDKHLMNELADLVGIPYPKTWYPKGAQDLTWLNLTYPVLVKPTMSTWLQHSMRRKALWAHDFAELRESYRTLAALVPPEEIVVQEAIAGDGHTQVSAAVFCRDGEVLGGMTARRTRQYPIDLGLSSCYVEAMPVPGLIELASSLVEELGLSGVAEVEFKQDERDGRYKLLDINVRLWGWHGLCVPCGMDFTSLLYQQAMGQDVKPAGPVYGWRWRRMLTDLPAALQEMRAGITTPWGYLASFARGRTVPSVFAADDPLPGVADIAVAVRRASKRTLNRRCRAATGHAPLLPDRSG